MRLQRFFFDGLILSSLALLACEAPPVEPIPGGGVRGAFAGELTVLVIDERGGAIEGAAILGGEGEDARSLGVTDASGALAIGEPVDVITALADGRAPVSVAGAGAAVVTIELAAPAARPTVRLSVPGFDAIALEGADYVRARAGFTLEAGVDSDEARQPASAVVECTRSDASSERCELAIATRASPHRVFVAIVRGRDPAGTPDDASDDELEPVALLLSDAIVPDAQAELEAALSPIERAELTEVMVSTDDPPAGLDKVVGVPGAAIEEGVIVWPFDSAGWIPANGAHWAVARASSETASSLVVVRPGGAYPDGVEVTVGAWRDPLAALTVEGGTIGAAGARQGELGRVEVRNAEGELAWSAHLLDARAAITPPATLEMPSSGAAVVIRSEHLAAEGELSFAEVERRWIRRASRRLDFSGCPLGACR